MSNKPAILGGQPAFNSKINIVNPLLPEYSIIANDVEELLTTGMLTKGKHLVQFEKEAADQLQVKHAVAVSSCTSGLMLTYQALGLSGEVIVPSFTFMATVSSLVWAGLKPVYVDVDSGTTNIDTKKIEEAITPDTSAIMAVHNFGNPADIDALESIASAHGLKLIFDAAHGFGTLYKGKPVGSQGNAQAFSLSPTKLLIAGEGGIVSTNDDELAAKLRMGREYGNSGNYDSAFAGMNSRMAEFNAILGIQSFALLEGAVQRRNEIVNLYKETLKDVPGIEFQYIAPENRCSYKDFSIVIDENAFGLNRDELSKSLLADNIDSRKYYEPPVHRQTAYACYYDGKSLESTEWLAKNSLSLPIWSQMDDEIILNIAESIKSVHEYSNEIKRVVS